MSIPNSIGEDYRLGVVEAGDEASGNFKGECNKANSETSHARDGLLVNTGRGWQVNTGLKGVETVVESIDGVGTKVQIYTNVFNSMIKEQEAGNITEQELFETSVELWERMLHDLIAMNVDDLRDGEMAVAVTNIIDINHLRGIRGKVFSDSMATAMGNIIRELDIAITAGETAILGEPKKVGQLLGVLESVIDKVTLTLDGIPEDLSRLRYIEGLKKEIEGIFIDHKTIARSISEDLEFNIGGTGLGVSSGKENLVPIESGHAIIALQEKPTANGIIGPRSNGITAIRKHLTALVGEGWEMLSFEEFLEKIGEEKASKIPEYLRQECMGLKMWDIATGKTTVFNPVISKKLLGGLDGINFGEVSSLIHVTGNPGRKIKEGLRGNDELGIEIDLDMVKIPQIIEILQRVCDISDDDAISGWNMGIPYVIVCNDKNVGYVVELLESNGIKSSQIGIVNNTGESHVKNVGVGKTNLSL